MTALATISKQFEMRIEEIKQIDGIQVGHVCFRICLEQRFWNWNWWHWTACENADGSEVDYSVFVTFSMEITSSEIVDKSYYPYRLYNKNFKQQRIEHTRLKNIWDNYILFPKGIENYTTYSENIVGTFQQNILNEFIAHLGTLRFDMLEGELTSPENSINFKELYNLPNIIISFEIEQCVVCYEKTRTFTNCSHFLCIACASRLQTQPKRCPLCRESPIYIQK